MNFVIRVKRAAGPAAPAVWQEFAYEGHESDSVAAALRELNARTPLTDLEGREAPPVRWECGCACGKCGACGRVGRDVSRSRSRNGSPVVK